MAGTQVTRMNWSPHVTVACVLEHSGQFLLIEEMVDGQLVLNQPAGHWEQNETLLQATVRETLEEAAWHYTPTHLTGIYHWQHPATEVTYLRFCFTGKLLGQEKERQLDTGIEQAVWLTYAQLMQRSNMHRSPLVKQCVDDYLKGQRFDLSLFGS